MTRRCPECGNPAEAVHRYDVDPPAIWWVCSRNVADDATLSPAER